MICASCGSEKLSRYEGKLVIHFPEPKGSNKSVVWIFPEMWFCLDCGNAGVSIRGGELHVLASDNEGGTVQVPSHSS